MSSAALDIKGTKNVLKEFRNTIEVECRYILTVMNVVSTNRNIHRVLIKCRKVSLDSRVKREERVLMSMDLDCILKTK